MDTVACQCFINRGMLTDLLTELAGDDGRSGRTLASFIASMSARCVHLHLGLSTLFKLTSTAVQPDCDAATRWPSL